MVRRLGRKKINRLGLLDISLVVRSTSLQMMHIPIFTGNKVGTSLMPMSGLPLMDQNISAGLETLVSAARSYLFDFRQGGAGTDILSHIFNVVFGSQLKASSFSI